MMMKRLLIVMILVTGFFVTANAQQRIQPGQMNYLLATKQNSIVYRDTLYSGSQQFKSLFYRTKDSDLIHFYEKHQANKIAGSALGLVGSIATITGISILSSGKSDKGSGWIWIGGGFASVLTGGYLIFMGQQNLNAAVTLFNQRYSRASLNIGVGDKQAGLVLKF
jgi:hypothetical protein